ncbi:MAG: MarR family transcriptional regulator [Dehalococcoidia bacterium]
MFDEQVGGPLGVGGLYTLAAGVGRGFAVQISRMGFRRRCLLAHPTAFRRGRRRQFQVVFWRAWFDIMNRLNAAPGRRLRMQELAEASLFTNSGITRLLDRIEQAGYVRRERTADGRRGVYVVLTPEGVRKLEQTWPGHIEAIHRHFGRYLDGSDAEAVKRAVAKVLAACDIAIDGNGY